MGTRRARVPAHGCVSWLRGRRRLRAPRRRSLRGRELSGPRDRRAAGRPVRVRLAPSSPVGVSRRPHPAHRARRANYADGRCRVAVAVSAGWPLHRPRPADSLLHLGHRLRRREPFIGRAGLPRGPGRQLAQVAWQSLRSCRIVSVSGTQLRSNASAFSRTAVALSCSEGGQRLRSASSSRRPGSAARRSVAFGPRGCATRAASSSARRRRAIAAFGCGGGDLLGCLPGLLQDADLLATCSSALDRSSGERLTSSRCDQVLDAAHIGIDGSAIVAADRSGEGDVADLARDGSALRKLPLSSTRWLTCRCCHFRRLRGLPTWPQLRVCLQEIDESVEVTVGAKGSSSARRAIREPLPARSCLSLTREGVDFRAGRGARPDRIRVDVELRTSAAWPPSRVLAISSSVLVPSFSLPRVRRRGSVVRLGSHLRRVLEWDSACAICLVARADDDLNRLDFARAIVSCASRRAAAVTSPLERIGLEDVAPLSSVCPSAFSALAASGRPELRDQPIDLEDAGIYRLTVIAANRDWKAALRSSAGTRR